MKGISPPGWRNTVQSEKLDNLTSLRPKLNTYWNGVRRISLWAHGGATKNREVKLYRSSCTTKHHGCENRSSACSQLEGAGSPVSAGRSKMADILITAVSSAALVWTDTHISRSNLKYYLKVACLLWRASVSKQWHIERTIWVRLDHWDDEHCVGG